MDKTEASNRLSKLVEDNLNAMLRDWYLTETSDVEEIYVVLWRRNGEGFQEYGTHRACLSTTDDTGMLVWGHYFNGRSPIVDAYKDFNSRIHEET